MSKLQWMVNYISVILQSEPTKYMSLFILTGASLLRNAVWYDGEILRTVMSKTSAGFYDNRGRHYQKMTFF